MKLIILLVVFSGLKAQPSLTGAPHFFPGSSRTSLTFNSTLKEWVASFTCEFTGDKPLDISWHYKGFRVHIDNNTDIFEIHQHIQHLKTESTLYITGFTSEFDVEFTCLATNPRGYFYHDLWMEAAPVLKYYDMLSEDAAIAECASFPNSQIFWQLPGLTSDRNNTEMTIETDDVNTTSILTFTLTGKDNGQEFRCCALSRNPVKQTDPLCSHFTMSLTQFFTMSYHSDCSQHEGHSVRNCSLACAFFSSSSNLNVTWHFCPSPAPDLDIPCYDITGDAWMEWGNKSVETILTMSDYETRIGEYTCQAIDENDLQKSHNFVIDGEQASSNSIVISQHNETDAFLECAFVANPISSAYWVVTGVGSSNGSLIIEEDRDSYDVDVNLANHAISTLTLKVEPFTKYDVMKYYCVVENSLNIMYSKELILQSQPEYSDFDIYASTPIINSGEDVSVICSITSEVVPENIAWRFLTEFDEYLTNGVMESEGYVHTSTLTFTANWKSDTVMLKCVITYDSAPSQPLIQNKNFKIRYEPQLFKTKSCSPKDFSEGGCRLSCTAQQDGRYTLEEERWIYYPYNESESFELPKDEELLTHPSPNRYRSTLFIEDYSAGFYECSFIYTNIEDNTTVNVKNTFQIDPEQKGALLGEICDSSHQCLSLNAKCINGKCICEKNISAAYGETACLKAASIGDRCLTNEQCFLWTESATCDESQHKCHCPEQSLYFKDPIHKCLNNASFGNKCSVNEECLMFKKLTACLNLTCQCAVGYTYNLQTALCVISANASTEAAKVSTGSVVGILLLVGIVVAVAAAVLSTSLKKYRKKQNRRKREQAANVNLENPGPGALNRDTTRRNSNEYFMHNPHTKVELKFSTASTQ